MNNLKEVSKAVGVSFNVIFPTVEVSKTGQISMVLQTHYADESEAVTNLPELFGMIDYHKARYELDTMKDAKRNLEKQLEDQKDMMTEMAADDHRLWTKQSEYKMPVNVATNLAKMEKICSRLKTHISYLDAEIKAKEEFVRPHEKKHQAKAA